MALRWARPPGLAAAAAQCSVLAGRKEAQPRSLRYVKPLGKVFGGLEGQAPRLNFTAHQFIDSATKYLLSKHHVISDALLCAYEDLVSP